MFFAEKNSGKLGVAKKNYSGAKLRHCAPGPRRGEAMFTAIHVDDVITSAMQGIFGASLRDVVLMQHSTVSMRCAF